MGKEVSFNAKLRRVQSDLKEPKDGTSRVVTTVALVAEGMDDNTVKKLAGMMLKDELDVSITTRQRELPLEHQAQD